MAVISPKIGLISGSVINVLFGLAMITMPLSFLAQYQLDLDAIEPAEKMMIGVNMQFYGGNLLLHAGVLMLTAMTGTDDAQATMALMGGLGCCVQIVSILLSVSFWTKLGVAAGGLYFNAMLFGLIAVLCFLGANYPPAFKMAPLGKSLYWGFLGLIAMYTFYVLAMVFATDTLLEGYGVHIQGAPYSVLIGMFKFGLAPEFLHIIMVLKSLIITSGSHNTYAIGRWMSLICVGWFFMISAMAMVWTTLNEDGKYDKIISGQYFNMLLWLIFSVLFYAPIARLDPELKSTIEKEVDGTYGFLK